MKMKENSNAKLEETRKKIKAACIVFTVQQLRRFTVTLLDHAALMSRTLPSSISCVLTSRTASLSSVQGAHLHCAIWCSEGADTGEPFGHRPRRSGITGAQVTKQVFALPRPRVMQPDDMFVCDMEERDISCPPAWKKLKKSQCTPLFMNAYTMRGGTFSI